MDRQCVCAFFARGGKRPGATELDGTNAVAPFHRDISAMMSSHRESIIVSLMLFASGGNGQPGVTGLAGG
jgi:hypothetical protein